MLPDGHSTSDIQLPLRLCRPIVRRWLRPAVPASLEFGGDAPPTGRSPNNQRNSLDGRAKPILTTGGEAVTKPSINSGENLSPQKVEMDNQLPPKKNLKEALRGSIISPGHETVLPQLLNELASGA